mmetsp:Transcript_10476/g.21567  ORF Transcript_10476/g.21567 Transcript_10476/m.21567 type:complete len:217 (-) Transcript_10476:1053-1703(-)
MSRSIISNDPRPIQNHPHRQVLNGHIVHHLIVSPLHKGGVNATKGLQTLARHTRRKGHGVLLCDTHVERALGEPPPEDIHTRPSRHGGGDANDGSIFRGCVDEGIGEDGSERGGRGLALDLDSGGDVELSHAVHAIAGRQGGGIPVSLLGLDVQQDRFVGIAVPQFLENGDEVVQVVSVDGTNVEESQFFEEGPSRDDSASVLVDSLVDVLDVLRK